MRRSSRRGPLEESLKIEQISSAEIERLLSIAGAAQGFLRHDLVGLLGLLMHHSHYMKHTASGEIELDLGRVREIAEELSSTARDIDRTISRFTLNRSIKWSLISSPSEIVQLVAADLAQNLQVISPLESSLQVLFPSSALYAIIFELARNAASHSPNSTVAIDLLVQSNRLLVSIHDAGTSLEQVLTDRLLVLDLIQPQLFKPMGGLSIVRRIAHYAGGLLLARRSRILGGTEISVHLPVTAYSLSEKTR